MLRRFKLDDADAMFRNWASDDEVTKYLTWPTHPDAGTTRKVLEDWVPRYSEDNVYHWAIVLKENGEEPIGDISVVSLDEDVSKAQIGYCMGRKWWHMGIMPEALKAVMDYLFDRVGFNRIEARHDANNPNSGKVMRKCGMKYEGTHRSSDRNNQGICDACWYALLKSER